MQYHTIMYSVHVISYWGFSFLVPSGSIFSPCLDFFTMDCRQVLMDRGSDFIALLRACPTFVFKWIILIQVEGLGQVPSCCNFYYGMKKIHISLLSLYSISCKQGLNSSEYSRNIEKTKPSGVLVIKTNACESRKWIWFEWISKGASKKFIIQSPSQGPTLYLFLPQKKYPRWDWSCDPLWQNFFYWEGENFRENLLSLLKYITLIWIQALCFKTGCCFNITHIHF